MQKIDKVNKTFDVTGTGIIEQINNSSNQITGSVLATVTENGKTWIAHEKHNLVVNKAKEILSRLLGATASSTYNVTVLKIGTMGHTGAATGTDGNGASTGDILSPLDPTASDLDLIDLTLDTNVQYVTTSRSVLISSEVVISYPDVTSIKFTTTFPAGEANGNDNSGSAINVAYTEAGLFTEADELFARETFPAIVKNDQRAITFVWTIQF